MRLKSRYWRVHTPLKMQMQAIECGAARAWDYSWLLWQVFITLRARVSVQHLSGWKQQLRYHQSGGFYGLEGEGYQMDIEELEKLRSPAILFWDSTHFLVLEGVSEKEVYLNDPAYGPIAISREEFKNHYSGVALVFKKGASFKKSEVWPGLWQKLKEGWKGYKSTYIFFFLSGILILLPTLAVPIVFRIFIDHHDSNMQGWKFEWLGILFFSTVFALFFNAFHLSS